jgi:competence protein ComEC
MADDKDWRARLRSWGLAQWTATLASLPILLLVFQQFSLVSPLANALAIPLVSFVITPLALLGALIPWWPLLAVAHWLFSGLMAFLVWCAGWPLWQAPAPPLWAVLLGGLGVVVALLPRGVPGRGLGLVMLIPLLFWPAQRPAAGAAEVTVLDVGQGLATVIRTHGHTLVYDPGPLYSAESDAGQRVVVPYLRWLGENRLDMLVVTHRDSDHAGGAASVLAAMPVAEIRSPVAGFRGQPCLAGQTWVWDGVEFSFLHPARQAGEGESAGNHYSCVLRIAAGDRRVLLTSDIEAADEAEMLARDAAAVRADVLLVPHHGSKTSSTPGFIAAVRATEAIFPVGYRNRFGHPKAEVVARHEAQGSRLWRSDRDGAVRVDLSPAAVAVRGWRHEHRRYWHGR